nr:AAA family ATPase [Acinetobacter sp. Marseille-Q1620]
MKKRIQTLISAISENMYEREHVIALSLLAAIAGFNTFLYGAPGTAKSLISRRIASAFEVRSYFEYLMNRFSTPEEIFGPVSIKALKQDQYLRKTEHYLPQADFAFLDEIWKASPAILNTLLTLLNEKIFKNGEAIEKVPLKVLMSASNEIPMENQGLDALYDRFILRLVVKPIVKLENFHALLQAKPNSAKVEIASDLVVKESELLLWREQIYDVQFPDDILKIIDVIKHKLDFIYDDHQIYVSDRRWQRIAYLLKTSAFLNDRNQVNLTDLFILQYCLWNQIDDIAYIEKTLQETIAEYGLNSDLDYDELIQKKDLLENKVLHTFYYMDDVYESYLIKDKEYLKAITNLDQHYKDKVLYLELNKMDTKKDFFAVDERGEEIRGIVCNFNGTRQCNLKGGYYGLEEVVTPYIKYEKGSKRNNVSAQEKYDLLHNVQELKEQFEQEKKIIQQRLNEQSEQFYSVFILKDEVTQLLRQVQEKITRYDLQVSDMQRLEQLCKQ